MRRPFILRCLPEALKEGAFYRWYHPVSERWHDLFKAASLRYAPGVRMELVATDVMHGCIALTGIHERGLSKHVAERGAKARGSTMVDVGANAGYFSLIWLAAHPDNSCIAFEASPSNSALLRRNAEANGLDDRLEVHALAAGREAGTLTFDPGPEEQTGWGGASAERSSRTVEVPVARIDEVVNQKREVDFMKVDVEGAEPWVLRGCEGLFQEQGVEEVYFEQNKERGRALGIEDDDAQEFLRSVGYEATPLNDPAEATVDWKATPKL